MLTLSSSSLDWATSPNGKRDSYVFRADRTDVESSRLITACEFSVYPLRCGQWDRFGGTSSVDRVTYLKWESASAFASA